MGPLKSPRQKRPFNPLGTAPKVIVDFRLEARTVIIAEGNEETGKLAK